MSANSVVSRSLTLAVFSLIWSAVAPTRLSYGETITTLYPDLSAVFVCDKQDMSSVEKKIVSFLSDHGFKSLNQAKIQHEHGYYFTGLQILGVDGSGRIVEFDALPGEGRYAATLTSQPPTQHDPALEGVVQKFISDTISCSIPLIQHHDNSRAAKPLYDRELNRIKGIFTQAEQLDKQAI